MTKLRLAVRAMCGLFGVVMMVVLAQGQGGGPNIIQVTATFGNGPTYYSATVSGSGKLIYQEVTTFKAGENRYVVYDWVTDPALPDDATTAGKTRISYERTKDAQGNPLTGEPRYNYTGQQTLQAIKDLGETKRFQATITPPNAGTYELKIYIDKHVYKMDNSKNPPTHWEVQNNTKTLTFTAD